MNKFLLSFAVAAVALSASAGEIITEQPQGTLYDMVQGSTECTYLVYNGMLGSTTTDVGYRTKVVIDGDDFYVHNILYSYDLADSWIKGTKNADNVVEFKFPQTIYANESTGFEVSINMLEPQIEDNTTRWVETTGDNTLKMSWDGKKLTQIKPGTSTKNDGFFGLLHEEGGFIGYGAYGLELEFTDEPLSLPKGIRFTSTEYSCTYKKNKTDEAKSLMTIYSTEGSDEVYIQGLNYISPKQLVKGTVNSDKNIEIASDQFMGFTYDGGVDNYTYLFGGKPTDKSYEWLDKVVLTLDGEIYKADCTVLINLGHKFPLLGLSLTDLVMTPMDAIVRTPAAPYESPEAAARFEWSEEDGMMGGGFMFDCVSTDGEPLDPEKVFFNVYFDDVLQSTTIDGEPYTDIPNTVEVTDDMLLYNTFFGYYCVFGFSPVKKVSIQVIYHNRDEITKSEMFEAFVEGIPEDGVDNIETDKEVANVEYFNLQGVALSQPEGFCIKRTTYNDGTVKTVKAFIRQ